jgi:glycosyltransferase involved in cell wall biosynthesis
MNNLTIAIPVFERMNFFEEALNSVLNQTVKCKVLVVDNNSSHTFFEEICAKFNVDYFKNSSNIGMFPNWNKCFELAQTEYVMILGDDDILDLNYVSIFQAALKENSDLDIFFSDFELLDNETKAISNHQHTFPYGYMNNGEKIVEYGILYRLGFPVITAVIKKKKFTGFYSDFHASNDWVWIYENIGKMVVYGEKSKLLKYRYHKSNDSKKPETLINCYVSILYIYKKLLIKYKNDIKFVLRLKDNISFINLFIYSCVERDYYNSIIKHNNKYSILLKEDSNILIKLLLLIPVSIRKLIYRLILKTGIVK